MITQFARTELLLGAAALKKLGHARVAVFGLGGVGGYVVEALSRCGVGALDLIDSDRISLTNLNRQILATHQTIGQPKVDVAAERVLAINPNCRITKYQTFYLPQNDSEFDFSQYDYVVDAIDTVTGKIGLIMATKAAGVPIISAMGTGNKLNPAAFEVADIYQTSVCPLAHVMRKELRRRGIEHLKVVYSKEKPLKQNITEPEPQPTDSQSPRKNIPASAPFVPPVAGFIIAGEVVKDLINTD